MQDEKVTPAQAGLIMALLAQIRVCTPEWANPTGKKMASEVIQILKALVDIQRMVDTRIVDCGRTIEELWLLGKGEEPPRMQEINEAKKSLLAFLPDPNCRPKLVGPATDSQLLRIVKQVGKKAHLLTEQELANIRQKLADKPTKEWASKAIKKLDSIS